MAGILPGGSDDKGDTLASVEEALLVADRLHLVVRPFMLRRLKADVAAELPPKVGSSATP